MPLEVKELTDEAGLRRYDALVPKAAAGSVFATRSWLDYAGIEARFFGVFKGAEVIAGVAVPHSGGHSLSVTQGTPWTGIVARPADEGEHLQVACELAQYLRGEFGHAALTLPPEWHDIRGFLWDGWRSHVRYTYRCPAKMMRYESRLRIREVEEYGNEVVHHGDSWQHVQSRCADSAIDYLVDVKPAAATYYYWNANPGGTWHAELIDKMIKVAATDSGCVDLVGCNSPQRSLFKRSFGGRLTPYYFVTTGDPATVKEFWGERRPVAA